jgi:glycosyltransferase involved in cell wall biosynthesis
MIDGLINTGLIPLVLGIALGVVFLVQLLFYTGFFRRLGSHRNNSVTSGKPGVSVVICAHNEYHHLKESLPLFLEQDYPEYEVLVVNHASDDDTLFLLNSLSEKYPHLKSLYIQHDLNFFSGKKFPLSIGIKSARYDTVLLTDADCIPASRNWVSLMSSAYTPKTEIVLGYGPYNRTPGLVNKLIRFDTAHIATQYLSFALAGIPYMGVGRNLSYVKSLFYRNNGFISHYRIRSGDDDLFVNRVANRRNTAIMTDPGSYTFSDPKQSFGTWITQKKRHLSTATHYRFLHKSFLGLYSLSLVLFYALSLAMLALNYSIFPVIGLFVIRTAVQYIIMAKCLRQLNEKDLLPFVAVYEPMLLLLNAGVMISNVIRKPVRWK